MSTPDFFSPDVAKLRWAQAKVLISRGIAAKAAEEVRERKQQTRGFQLGSELIPLIVVSESETIVQYYIGLRYPSDSSTLHTALSHMATVDREAAGATRSLSANYSDEDLQVVQEMADQLSAHLDPHGLESDR